MIKELLLFTFDKLFVNSAEQISKLLICVPSEITETEKAAILQLGETIGVLDIHIDEEIKAAAIGCGVDIYTPSGHLIVDIGGGTTDFGVICLGDVVISKSIKVAGDYFDKQIRDYIKEKHKLEVGPQTAERVKVELASLTGSFPVDEEGNPIKSTAMGRDLVSGLPQKVVLEASEIREILIQAFEQIKASLIATLESTPPELAGDLVDNGIIVTGGGAQILGIKTFLEDVTKVNVIVSQSPMTAVVEGTKKLLKMERNHYFGEF
jgi:rod shape-determining protein MreB